MLRDGMVGEGKKWLIISGTHVGLYITLSLTLCSTVQCNDVVIYV